MDVKDILDFSILGISIKGPLIFFIKVIIIYAFCQTVVSIIKYLFRKSMKRKSKLSIDKTSAGFVQRMIVYTIYILGMVSVLAMIPGMKTVTNSILASAGILTAAVGLASQDALANIIGGVFIIFTKPFRVGDFIKVDDIVVGTVLEITLRHTVIRNAENRTILIPNSKINSSTIINSTIDEEATCSFVEVGVSYTVNLDKAIDVMRAVIMRHPMLIDHRNEKDKAQNVPQVIIRVMDLGDSSITLRAWAWAGSSGDAFVMRCELLKAIKEQFDKENIEIPYPYFNNVIIKS